MEILLAISFFLLLILASFLVPVALSRYFVFRGWLANDHVMITENNGSFNGMTIRSDTHSFMGGNDPVKKWEIVDKPTKMTWWQSTTGTFNIGFWPIAKAKRVFIPINRLDVIRPTKPREEIQYTITEIKMVYRGFPRSLKHAFQTKPVETMGDRNGQCKINEHTELVALVTEILSIDFEIYNPYLAIMRVQDVGGVVNFMQHLNETLQSLAREVTSLFTYPQIIGASVERSKGGDADKQFGERFREMSLKPLEKYGIRITNIDLVDHYLDEKTQEALLAPQRAKMRAEANIIEAEGDKQVKELLAEGDAAVIRTILREVNGDKELALAEMRRRGLTDASRFAGEKFNGQFLTLNLGGEISQGPQPAVNVGSVEPDKQRTSKK